MKTAFRDKVGAEVLETSERWRGGGRVLVMRKEGLRGLQKVHQQSSLGPKTFYPREIEKYHKKSSLVLRKIPSMEILQRLTWSSLDLL